MEIKIKVPPTFPDFQKEALEEFVRSVEVNEYYVALSVDKSGNVNMFRNGSDEVTLQILAAIKESIIKKNNQVK